MSTQSSADRPSYGHGFVIGDQAPNYIIGRLLTLIEALGLKEKQEESLKSLVRQEVWAQFAENNFGCVYINPSMHDEIRKVTKEIEREERKNQDPSVPGTGLSDYEFQITYKKNQ